MNCRCWPTGTAESSPSSPRVTANYTMALEDDTIYVDENLDPLTSYTYRIRYFRGEEYSLYSNVAWVMTLASDGAPAYAHSPQPPDSSESVALNSILYWMAGAGSESHDVYFGMSIPPAFQGNQTETNFNPGELEENTTYYWRIDEVNQAGTTEGVLWMFTTLRDPLPPQLVAHWTLNEGTGSTIEDATVNGNNGTLINMNEQSWVEGIEGSALYFDGIDDYVNVPDEYAINFADQDFSISFWLKQSMMDKAMRYIIKGTHTSPGSGKRYEVFHHASNVVRFSIDDNVTKSRIEVPNTDFVTGEWVHVVAVRDKTDGQLLLYANTHLQDTANDLTGDISQDEDLYFGVSPDEDNTNLSGSLDDIRFFNFALDDSTIQELYDQMITSIDEKPGRCIPVSMHLNNYPNPFNPVTTIRYSIPQKGKVVLSVFNLLGQEVDRLVDTILPAGVYDQVYHPSHLASGIYLCRLSMDGGVVLKKIVLLK